jgi:hypothetical protein
LSVAYRFEQPTVVEPVDLFERGELDRSERAPWPAPVDHLGFQTDHRLGKSVDQSTAVPICALQSDETFRIKDLGMAVQAGRTISGGASSIQVFASCDSLGPFFPDLTDHSDQIFACSMMDDEIPVRNFPLR